MTTSQRLPSRFEFGLFQRAAPPQHRLLLLDYDGTLAPFHAERSAALPYEGVGDALTAVINSAHSRTVVISGRPATEVRGLLGRQIVVEIWGAHGWERLTTDNRLTKWTPGAEQQAALRGALEAIRGLVPEDQIECKTASIAVHLRCTSAADVERAQTIVRGRWSSYMQSSGLALLEFDGGLELRDPSRTKATVVDALLAESPPKTFAAYMGDDGTDEDAFARVHERGWALLVSSQTQPSAATFTMCPPHEVLRFLREWARWL